MKKLMVAVSLVLVTALSAKADFFWSTWFRSELENKSVKGCVLGLASEVKKMSGVQIDLCISKAGEFKNGCQYAVGYSRAKVLRNGVQIAFWNNASSAALQLGLICHNKTGFLPWFILFNFDGNQFGAEK